MSEILPKYSFLPWLRQGIANQITLTDNLGDGSPTIDERVTINLKVKVKGNGAIVSTLNTDVNLVGPGDIIGISPNAIIKTEPLNWITNFEPNYFPYIEFYDEDLPWRYTPAAPTSSHKLRPWFVLVVLKADEFTKHVPMEGTLPSIEVPGNLDELPFPVYNETWAWTHVHVNGDLYTSTDPLIPSDQNHVNEGIERMKELIADNPDLAISRMICPRELDANTDYYAFLIPAFETGRMAGLGIDTEGIATIDAQLPSWGITGSIHHPLHQPNCWPVYHEWYFKTGAAGDFEYLVRQIVPRTLNNKIGKRPMDIQDPGYLLNHSDDIINGALQLEGALRIPGNAMESYPWLPADTIYAIPFRENLTSLINLGQNILDNTLGSAANIAAYSHLGLGSNFQDDPIISPPLYGRWHALKKTVNATGTGWIDELNIDPRNRAVAGIGTRVIQKEQDKLMDVAWGQVGEIIEANKKLKWAQTSKEVGSALFERHIKSQPKEEKLQLTAKLHKKIKTLSGNTIYKINKNSILPLASESHAFRRIRRTNGPVMKRLDPLKSIGNSAGAAHITAKMASATPIQAADFKVIALQATQTTVSAIQNVIGYSSVLSTGSYNFSLTVPGATYTPAATNAAAIAFQSAVALFEEHFDALNWQPQPVLPALNLTAVSAEIDEKTNPLFTFPARVYHSQQLQFSKPVTLPSPNRIVPILAAPSFRQPMYEAVRDLSTDLLIPNLNLIPQNTISLLETNPKFIESYMVGLNHEMGRELLWREYPTDQRGTYFKHFWDATDFVDTTEILTRKQLEDKVGDITPIHTWGGSLLGTHNNRSTDGGTTSEAKVVLTIRGDLLKKYPGAVIYAQRAKWQLKDDGDGNMIHDYSKPRRLEEETELYPIFGAKIEPDINFIGFDLNVCDVRGDEVTDQNAPHNSYDPGYFFVIKERPGEVRFGADIASSGGTLNTWSDLRWDHIQKSQGHVQLAGGTISPSDNKIPAVTGIPVSWSSSSTSADLAMATFQNPMLVAIHAKEMLNEALIGTMCPE